MKVAVQDIAEVELGHKGDIKLVITDLTGSNFSIDGKIESRMSANKQLKDAGIKQKV